MSQLEDVISVDVGETDSWEVTRPLKARAEYPYLSGLPPMNFSSSIRDQGDIDLERIQRYVVAERAATKLSRTHVSKLSAESSRRSVC